jgi:hypothetical protein
MAKKKNTTPGHDAEGFSTYQQSPGYRPRPRGETPSFPRMNEEDRALANVSAGSYGYVPGEEDQSAMPAVDRSMVGSPVQPGGIVSTPSFSQAVANVQQRTALPEVSRTPLIGNTKTVSRNEVSTPVDSQTDAYIRDLMRRQRNPITPVLPGNLQNPEYQGATTQQGWSGFGFSIPTIYGAGGLFPFAVSDARRAQSEKLNEELAYNTPEFAELTNKTKQPDFLKAQENAYQGVIDRYAADAQNKYGDARYGNVMARPVIEKMQRNFKSIAEAEGQAFKDATNVLSDTDNYYSKYSRKAAEDFIGGYDQWVNNPTLEASEKAYSTIQELKKFKNVEEVVSKALESVDDQIATEINKMPNWSNADYDTYSTGVYKGKFMSQEKDGSWVIDDGKVDKYALETYVNQYPDAVEVQPDGSVKHVNKYAPPFKDYKDVMRDKLAVQVEKKLTQYGKYNAAARVWEEKEKVKVVAPAGDESYALKDEDGNVYQVTGKANVGIPDKDKSGKDIKISVSSKMVYDPDSRQYYRIDGSVDFKPQSSSVVKAITVDEGVLNQVKDPALKERLSRYNSKAYVNDQQADEFKATIEEYNSANNANINPDEFISEKRIVSGAVPSDGKSTVTSMEYKKGPNGKLVPTGKNVSVNKIGNKGLIIEEAEIGAQMNTINGYDDAVKQTSSGGGQRPAGATGQQPAVPGKKQFGGGNIWLSTK